MRLLCAFAADKSPVVVGGKDDLVGAVGVELDQRLKKAHRSLPLSAPRMPPTSYTKKNTRYGLGDPPPRSFALGVSPFRFASWVGLLLGGESGPDDHHPCSHFRHHFRCCVPHCEKDG